MLPTIFTIGHGNRSIEEFVGLLREAGIRCLVDVRAFPGSRRHPHFGREALQERLAKDEISYLWEGAALGGRRKSKPDSHHTALRNDNFRAYADHMETSEFALAVQRVLARGKNENVAIMCAERLPWQCHRFLISDYLVAHGNAVLHLVSAGKPQPHRVNAIARARDGRLFYESSTQSSLQLELQDEARAE
jgi:uncharacterized protein (DUF488 family)